MLKTDHRLSTKLFLRPTHLWFVRRSTQIVHESKNSRNDSLEKTFGAGAFAHDIDSARSRSRSLLSKAQRGSEADPRGEFVISLLSLNRTELLTKRNQAIRTLGNTDFKVVLTNREFAGCLLAVLRARRRNKKRSRREPEPAKKREIIKQTAGVGPQPFQYIRRIQIRNFRAIEKLKIEIPQTHSDTTGSRQGWKIVLGENAAGKSTVLKAIAFALIGQKDANALALKPKEMLRRWNLPGGSVGRARKGHIKLEFLSGLEHSVEFDQNRIRFKSGASGMQGPIRAFGSMRLLPDANPTDASQAGKSTDVQNLFNPRRSLVAAEKYLLGLAEDAFNAFAKALKALLGLQSEKDIERRDNCVYFHLEDAPIALDELSDGYQCMVALAVDFMSSISNFSEMQFVEGIVLLDELGTHLHPRWRMAFVQRFRDCFNRVQVIGTTHEPLCLLGLEQDEVMLLRRGPDHRIESVDEDLPNPAGMRADQILTSSLFGLNSTIDPRLEEQFQQYYKLLAIPENELTADQRGTRERLARELRPKRALGFTRRDQAMYEFIDEYLAKELTTSSAVERRRLKEQTMQKLREIWAEVDVDRLPQ